MKLLLDRKAKSSAIIIALVIGAIMSVVMIGSSLIVGQRLQITAQSRQGKLAYRAALSGIEDGLMLVKQAKSEGKLDKVLDQSKLGNTLLVETSSRRRIYHNLTISAGPISGFPAQYRSASNLNDALLMLGNPNAVTTIGRENIEKFSKVNIDNIVDIDIPSSFTGQSISIYFSKPHFYNAAGVPTFYKIGDGTNSFTPLNVRLIDSSATSEKQVVFEQTAASTTEYKVVLNSTQINLCKQNNQCKLRIRPQVAKTGTKFKGETASSITGKFIYFATVARDAAGALVDYGDSRPGVVTVESTGFAGQAVRKLQAKVDTTTGSYLGLFDFGIYCGDKCDGRGIDEL